MKMWHLQVEVLSYPVLRGRPHVNQGLPLGVSEIGYKIFSWDCICWNIIKVLLLQAMPRLYLYRIQHVSACHPYMLSGGVNVKLPLAQHNYHKNG
jgi:hypothetical protein